MLINQNDNLYVDVHAIQSIPASNINSDDLGAPKSVVYGGVTRQRVSSQAWKKVIREGFEHNMDRMDLGVRTKDMVTYLADRVQDKDDSISHDDAMKGAEKVLDNILGKKQLTKSKTASDQHKVLKTMLFMGNRQADNLAQAIIDGKTGPKDADHLKKLLKDDPSVDLAMFGRMVASDPALNEDASVEYAHAISTHASQPANDFFTGTDDFDSTGGAGMIGNSDFSTSTLYRYANVDAHHLLKQMNGDKDKTSQAIALFLRLFALTIPNGHIHSFGNRTLPSAIVVTVRNDRPTSLVNAFEAPVTANNGHGYIQGSKQRLADEYQRTNDFVNPPEFNLTIGMKDLLGDDQGNLNSLLKNFVAKIGPLLNK